MTATVSVVNATHVELRLPYACGFIHVGPCLGGGLVAALEGVEPRCRAVG
jgi:hypothetical protein